MTKRAMVAAGLAVAVMTQVAPALAQSVKKPAEPNPNANVDISVQAQAPAADVPLVKVLPEPTVVFEGGAGVLGYVGGTAALGPTWTARVGVRLAPRIDIEGNYVGSANQRSDGTGTLIYTSVDASGRFNILRGDQAPLVPFVTAGVGYAGWGGPNGDGAALVLPVAIGADRMLTRNIRIGARLNLRPALYDNLGTSNQKEQPGGDTWSLAANLGGAF